MGYQIFSDSSCDLPEDLIVKNKITLVPFYVTFDQENYFKENVDITNEEFYERLRQRNVFPKTSLPSVQDYINKFSEAVKAGTEVLCLCLTQKFSGSYQSAVNAKQILDEKYPDANIAIVDSIQATGGQGMVLLQAAYLQQAGFTLRETVDKINVLKQTARIMFTVDTLEYLAKGGRIGKVTSLAGTMLNLKPMIQLKDAELIPYSNVRGRKKSLDKIIYMVKEYFDDTGENYEDYDFCCLSNADSPEEVNLLITKFEELTGRKLAYPLFPIGVTIATYTGPGALGICFIKKFNK